MEPESSSKQHSLSLEGRVGNDVGLVDEAHCLRLAHGGGEVQVSSHPSIATTLTEEEKQEFVDESSAVSTSAAQSVTAPTATASPAETAEDFRSTRHQYTSYYGREKYHSLEHNSTDWPRKGLRYYELYDTARPTSTSASTLDATARRVEDNGVGLPPMFSDMFEKQKRQRGLAGEEEDEGTAGLIGNGVDRPGVEVDTLPFGKAIGNNDRKKSKDKGKESEIEEEDGAQVRLTAGILEPHSSVLPSAPASSTDATISQKNSSSMSSTSVSSSLSIPLPSEPLPASCAQQGPSFSPAAEPSRFPDNVSSEYICSPAWFTTHYGRGEKRPLEHYPDDFDPSVDERGRPAKITEEWAKRGFKLGCVPNQPRPQRELFTPEFLASATPQTYPFDSRENYESYLRLRDGLDGPIPYNVSQKIEKGSFEFGPATAAAASAAAASRLYHRLVATSGSSSSDYCHPFRPRPDNDQPLGSTASSERAAAGCGGSVFDQTSSLQPTFLFGMSEPARSPPQTATESVIPNIEVVYHFPAFPPPPTSGGGEDAWEAYEASRRGTQDGYGGGGAKDDLVDLMKEENMDSRENIDAMDGLSRYVGGLQEHLRQQQLQQGVSGDLVVNGDDEFDGEAYVLISESEPSMVVEEWVVCVAEEEPSK